MVTEKDLKTKYKQRIKAEMEGSFDSSKDYKSFLSEFRELPRSFYEKACKFSEKLGITPDKVTAARIQDAADFARLQITPKGAYSFAILGPLIFILFFGMLSFLVPKPFFLFFLVLIGGLGAIAPLLKMPFYLSDNYRLRASNEMVLAVFYLVTYLRHTSNLERAVEFAADHLSPPLSDEFRKVLWDVENGNFSTITESLENFLDSWRENNPEFVDALHLIEGSLLEGSEERRLQTLEKALNLILDETYEKMLHFAHNLQSPITTLHMLGVILPILGLVILPLVLSFLGDGIAWYHISVLYNVFLPVGVMLLGVRILSKRPCGYGQGSMDSKEIREAKKATVTIGKFDTNIKPKVFGMTILVILVLIGFVPIFMNMFGVEDFGWGDVKEDSNCGYDYCFLDNRPLETGGTDGPFSLSAAMFSLFIVMGIGVGFGLYYKFKSAKLVKIFDRSKKLESEFSSSLFQLGNRLGDNLPAEIATLKVAETMPDTASGNFFKIVAVNIQKLGMSVKDAIFSTSVGALLYYPSSLIDSSMRVLIQSAKKGPLVASNALINISRYIKEMHKVEERLTDLMAEVVSSMKSQIAFLTPVISAVVVGITSMISTIMGILSSSVGSLTDGVGSGAAGFSPEMLSTFFKGGVPTFYFQLIVGIYVVQITAILTILVNTIKNGADPVHRDAMLGANLTKATLTYVFLSAGIMLLFNMVVVKLMPAL